jgi:hypothetical protein
MVVIRSKVSYRTKKKGLLEAFIVGVKKGIYENPGTFVTPPMAEADLMAIIATWVLKYNAYTARTLSKASMEETWVVVITTLNTFSVYVDSVAMGNAITIALGGFEPTKGSSSDVNPPAQPTGVTITRTAIPTKLVTVTECAQIPGAETYGALLIAHKPLPEGFMINASGQIIVMDDEEGSGPAAMAAVPGIPEIKFVIDLTKTRKKKFIGLEIGVTYYLYYWAINAGGVSPLSGVVSRKVTEL